MLGLCLALASDTGTRPLLVALTAATQTLTEADQKSLTDLSGLVSDLLETQKLKQLRQHLEDKTREVALLTEVARQTINGVVVTDPSGLITWVNQGFERLTGYSRAEAIGRKPGQLLQGDRTDPETIAYIGQQLSLRQGFQAKLVNYHRNGRAYWVRIHCEPLVATDGSFSGFMAIQTDITDTEEARNDLQRFRKTLDSTLDCVFMFDAQTLQFFYLNQGALDQLGYSRDELLGMHPYDIKPEFTEAAFRAMVAPLINQEVPRLNFQTVHRRKDGRDVPVEVFLQCVVLDNESPRFIAIVRDITEQQKQQKAIEHLAYFDPLTDLPNRRMTRQNLQSAMSRAEKSGQFGAVLLTDLDDFKSINDTLGHRVGDKLLIEIARRFETAVGERGELSRLGGDEFLVVMEGLGATEAVALEAANQLARDILEAAATPAASLGGSKPVSTSIGLVLFNDRSIPAGELMRMADIAMYDAKNRGKNSIRVFDDTMQQRLLEELDLTSDLVRALDSEQELVPWYQPKVDRKGQWQGFEALARWHHPTRGLLGPGQFIELAESKNLIAALSDKVLVQACRQMAEWRDSFPISGWTVSVNISQSQLAQLEFPGRIEAILKDTGLPASSLRLEITESTVAEDITRSIRQMRRLKKLGVTFSLDDFGTGYSSLSYLRQLPIDELKIDRSFVDNMLDNEESLAITKAILELAASLELMVVAEGVEHESQWQALRQMGCDGFQGYRFSRPLPASDTELQLPEQAHSSGALLSNAGAN
ncbi:MAG: EAL domain-containing protein [Pseudomonadota bacterium]|nr:EAL domain-containing protein [Pseudomonadota bacterium]